MANRAKNDSANPATWCPECGPSVPIDEDGLCAACGATAIGPGADLALSALDSASREKARADAAEARVKELKERIKIEEAAGEASANAAEKALERVRELEAQCAAMRGGALESGMYFASSLRDIPGSDAEARYLHAALSGDAGRALLELVKALERVAEEADATAVAADPSSSLWAALHALRALEDKR